MATPPATPVTGPTLSTRATETLFEDQMNRTVGVTLPARSNAAARGPPPSPPFAPPGGGAAAAQEARSPPRGGGGPACAATSVGSWHSAAQCGRVITCVAAFPA